MNNCNTISNWWLYSVHVCVCCLTYPVMCSPNGHDNGVFYILSQSDTPSPAKIHGTPLPFPPGGCTVWRLVSVKYING